MKVALNPAELRLIVDALDDTRQFQLQSGGREGEGGVGKCSRHRRVTTLSFALLRYSVAI
jgi:hypothetical protein